MKKIFLCIMLLQFIFLSCGRGMPDLPYIDFMAGEVMVNENRAETGMKIPHGSSIWTAPGSGCDIMVNKKTILRLKENSDVVLYFDGTSGCVNINSGTVLGVIKRLNPSRGGVYTLKTSTASILVRGTTFFIKVENPHSTYLCDCNGTLTVRDAFFGQKRELRSVMHQAVRIRKTYRGLVIQEASRQYHTDREMESLALKVGYELNWREMDNY